MVFNDEERDSDWVDRVQEEEDEDLMVFNDEESHSDWVHAVQEEEKEKRIKKLAVRW